ncbi:MAG: pyridoxamine 5'-phosphate oxidase family protein [Pseudomonadota bacterium]
MTTHADSHDDVSAVALESMVNASWSQLARALSQPSHPMRFPVVATRTASGVDARIVVLRHADQATRTLEFHTDTRSAKRHQLDKSAALIWVFYDPETSLQLRFRGRALRCRDEQMVADRWTALAEHVQKAYTQSLAPGTIVDAIVDGAPCPNATDTQSGRQHFAVMHCAVDEIEWLRLSRHGHQRARMVFADEWTANWVMP